MIDVFYIGMGVIVGVISLTIIRMNILGRFKCPECGNNQWLVRSRAFNERLSYTDEVNDMSEWDYKCKGGCRVYMLWKDTEGYSLNGSMNIDVFKPETVRVFLNGVLEWDPRFDILVRIVDGNSFGYHVFTNDEHEVNKWIHESGGYSITRKSDIVEVNGKNGLLLTFSWNERIAQQVDSAEASTIAVPPSDPSGSPR